MRSEIVKYRRPFFVAMGRTREETDKPFVGIVNSQNELVPGHEHLDQIARCREGRRHRRRRHPLRVPQHRHLRRLGRRATPVCAIPCPAAS